MAKLEAANTYTDAELLALAREGIATILVKGQSYEFMGRQFERADLADLQAIERHYEAKVSASSSGLISVDVNLKRAD